MTGGHGRSIGGPGTGARSGDAGAETRGSAAPARHAVARADGGLPGDGRAPCASRRDRTRRTRRVGALCALMIAAPTATRAEPVAALLRDWTTANGLCRGGSGDDPRTQAACERRDGLDRRLAAAGWCYGRPADTGAQRAWQPCGDGTRQPAQAGTETPQGAARRALLDVARGPAETGRGQPVQFVVHALNRVGPWAFLFARMQRPDGRPLPRAADDLDSNDYAALLRQDGNGWRVVDFAVGPTDVAWEGWDRRYGAPASVFAVR